jgi:RNA polymerase sigma factor (sigma-70 family)
VEGQTAETPEELLRAVEREQMLREAQWSLSPRCRRLVHMLFYEVPPRPYAEVAEQLGIAKGSIGFIRQRCLARLRTSLTKAGFR